MKIVFRLPGRNAECWHGRWIPFRENHPDARFLMRGFDLDKEPGFRFIVERESPWDHTFPEPQNLLPISWKSTSEQTYRLGVEQALSWFHHGEADKLVLSRIHIEPRGKKSLAVFFDDLSNAYLDCFVAMAELPNGTIWIGASPEKLLQIENGEASTVALAGTGLEKTDIGRKEEIEHRWVEQFISEQLVALGMNFQTKGPGLVKRNQLYHLETQFSWPVTGQENKLLDALHPTPAVGSSPINEWKKLLPKVEQHPRDFYAGYWGLSTDGGDCHLFVNLRCCAVWRDAAVFYAGAGLTNGSESGAEWAETTRKLQSTLKYFSSDYLI